MSVRFTKIYVKMAELASTRTEVIIVIALLDGPGLYVQLTSMNVKLEFVNTAPVGTITEDTHAPVTLAIRGRTVRTISMNVRPIHIYVRTRELVETRPGVIIAAVGLGGLETRVEMMLMNVDTIRIYATMEHVPIHVVVINVAVLVGGKETRVMST